MSPAFLGEAPPIGGRRVEEVAAAAFGFFGLSAKLRAGTRGMDGLMGPWKVESPESSWQPPKNGLPWQMEWKPAVQIRVGEFGLIPRWVSKGVTGTGGVAMSTSN